MVKIVLRIIGIVRSTFWWCCKNTDH